MPLCLERVGAVGHAAARCGGRGVGRRRGERAGPAAKVGLRVGVGDGVRVDRRRAGDRRGFVRTRAGGAVELGGSLGHDRAGLARRRVDTRAGIGRGARARRALRFAAGAAAPFGRAARRLVQGGQRVEHGRAAPASYLALRDAQVGSGDGQRQLALRADRDQGRRLAGGLPAHSGPVGDAPRARVAEAGSRRPARQVQPSSRRQGSRRSPGR